MASGSSSKKYVEPAPAQSDLNKFLGVKGAARQKTLNWSKSNPLNNQHDVPADMAEENQKDVVMAQEIQGAAEVQPSKEGSSKLINKRPVIIDSDEDDEAADESIIIVEKKPAKKIKIGSESVSPKAVKKSLETSKSTPAKASSSFFAPKSATKSPVKAKQPVKAVGSAASKKAAVVAKGKGKGKAIVEEDSDDDGDDAEKKEEVEEEEDESDNEAEDAEKLADIFTRKPSTSTKKVDWKDGSPVPYAALTATFHLISLTTKRLEISAYMTRFLIDVIEKTPGDLLKVVYLCINRLAPDYDALELGIGESLLLKAIAGCTGRKVDQIRADYKKVGDLGEVALTSRQKQPTMFKPAPLTVAVVFNKLTEIAKITGNSSQEKKIGIINKMFVACIGSETKFLIRALEGKLRIGLAEKTVLVALSHAIVTTELKGKKLPADKMSKRLEKGADILKSVFSELPSYNLVIPILLKDGIDDLKSHCFLTPGIPLKPMLAKPTKAITEVLDRFEGKSFTCEYKYDGERAQVHFLEDGSIKVFSRNSLDMTSKYPEFTESLPRCIQEGTTSFVIDAEAVAWDREVHKLLPFQELSRRKRKDVKAEEITVKVHLFAFDLLYLNGESLLHVDLGKRRELMRKHLQPVEGEFAFATSEDATDVADIQIFLDKSVKEGCEGLMVKLLEGEGASYEPSRRSINWLKLKKDYLAGVGDSFDLVVIGADFGKGKRTNFYGAFHLACYDEESSTYQSICKIGTGFTDEVLQSHYEFLHPLELEMKKAYYDTGTGKSADVYFEPRMVWEVLAADLSLSPIYTAGKGLVEERGISLRFPRFLRIRDDKGPEDSTNPQQIADAYQNQATAGNGAGSKKRGGGDDDGDFW